MGDFSEKIKNEVKRRAHYKCCMCEEITVDVHHIIPEKDGGTDDIDNAAPLYGHYHDLYGDNPMMRKTTRRRRDLWYELCEKSEQKSDFTPVLKKMDGLFGKLKDLEDNQEEQRKILNEMRQVSADFLGERANQVATTATPEEIISTASGSTAASIIDEPLGFQSYPQLCKWCDAYPIPQDASSSPRCGKLLL
jgi:hypothetical protein